jgi:uncharacterized protein (TIGR02147 family)
MPDIFEYFDYRKFLQDFYERKKKENPIFSYRFIANKVGLDHSLIVRILEGKRHISDKKIRSFAGICKLQKREEAYFEALVRFGKAKSDQEAKIYFEQLLALKRHPSRIIQSGQYEYFKKWYYVAVRSCLEYIDFRGDYKALAGHLEPPITVKQARDAVKLLLNLGLVEKLKDGKYVLTDKHLSTGTDWLSFAIKDFQKESIRMSAGSLDRHAKEVRDISTVTMAIDTDCLDDIKERLTACRNDIIRMVDKMYAPGRVYQLNVQFFPLTGEMENTNGNRE